MNILKLIELLSQYKQNDIEFFIEFYDSGKGECELAAVDGIRVDLDREGQAVRVVILT